MGLFSFALYVNELPSLVSMFADAIELYCTMRSPEDGLILQRDINVLLERSKYQLLSFNVAKCKVVRVGNYCLNEIQLELLGNIQDLDIQVDSKLKFHAHTNTVTKKAYVFWALSVNLLNVNILMLLLDYIQLLYAPSLNIITFYGDLLKYLDNQKLERIQCKATRIIMYFCISSLTCCAYNCLICFYGCTDICLYLFLTIAIICQKMRQKIQALHLLGLIESEINSAC